MKITFLGTGTSQGIPIIGCKCEVCCSKDKKDNRLRSSILIQDSGVNIVVDIGPDFRYQMLRVGIDYINGILITHEHKDHVAGLDDVRPFNFIQKKDIDIYSLERVFESIRQEFSYIFKKEAYPGIPKLNLVEIKNKDFFINDILIKPIKVWHGKLEILGFRIKDFTYITDASKIDKEEITKIKGTRVLVINALQKEPHPSHFSLDEALSVIEEIKPEKTYLTHISHKMGFHNDIQKILPNNVFPAYDTLEIEIRG